MKSLTTHQPHATLGSLGVQRLFLFDERPGLEVGDRVVLISTDVAPDWDDVEAFNDRLNPAGFEVTHDGHHWHLAVRDDEVETGFTLGDWTSDNTTFHRLPLASLCGTAVVEAVLPVTDIADAYASDMERGLVTVDPRTSRLWVHRGGGALGRSMADQLAYVQPIPGQFALLLGDAKPTTDRCPTCWGNGAYDSCYGCPTCDGSGTCPPLPQPATSTPGIQEWER